MKLLGQLGPAVAKCPTFVLQHAVGGLQHSLVEVLSKGLRREPLQGPSAAVVHRDGLLLQC